MALSARTLALGLAILSAVLLGSAFALEHLGGMRPCPLCLWQRWPWAAAIVLLAAGAAFGRPRGALALGAVVLAVGAGLATWHLGVEQGLLPLPETCAAAGSATTVAELMAQLDAAPARCDQVAALFGISLAAWNLLASLLVGAAAIAGAVRAR